MGTAPSIVLWTAISLASSAALLGSMFTEGETRKMFLPGATTSGHYQIELACESCHTDPFGGVEQFQSACERCHGAELERANDSHPKAKFTDPRNAERVALLDARKCVTCHQEHNPAATNAMGVTLPEDYCAHCHADIAEDRPSHEGMPFDSCDDVGCHNFHDNRALYEGYLERHVDTPAQLERQLVLALSEATGSHATPPAPAADIPQLSAAEQQVFDASAHGRASVGCASCHSSERATSADSSVSHETCAKCHQHEAEGWLAGRHGMREAEGLGAMVVGEARATLNPDRSHEKLSCNSCHSAHATDTRHAAAAACQGCHVDEHSNAYAGSTHAALWTKELTGEGAANSGVSCATCHMPRVDRGDLVVVEHNQNDNLRPREKMVRSVCTQCHGTGFALAALADEDLVRSNFSAAPQLPLPSMQLVERRLSN